MGEVTCFGVICLRSGFRMGVMDLRTCFGVDRSDIRGVIFLGVVCMGEVEINRGFIK